MRRDEFIKARGGEQAPDGDALWFVFAGPRLLLHGEGESVRLPTSPPPELRSIGLFEPFYLGQLDGTPCIGGRLSDEEVPAGYVGHDLRSLYGLVPENTWAAAGLAFQLTYWMANTRYCPRTGEPTQLKPGEWAMVCPSCDLLQYPHVSPCVIVLVHDGDHILLTRQAAWPKGRYGLVAGFVEPGESLEECLAREVREETGLAVTEMAYVDSQPWPFPHQLMVGFTARHGGGEIVVDKDELEDAAWFSIDALPILPPPLSIARRLIDAYVGRLRAERSTVRG